MKKFLAVLLGSIVFTPAALADHAWGDYHWARTTSSFDLIVVNSTTADWDQYVTDATLDWSDSTVLNLTEDATGDTGNGTRKKCQGPDGAVRICNSAYGPTGWLGVAGISIDTNGHIVTGYTKLNDTYFADPFYDKFSWKQSVTCQELGHNVGLGHQDEDFNNQSLFSCMDYQNPPYEYPNAHDYDQLEAIYGHLDSYDSYAASLGGGDGGDGGTCNAPPGKGCNKGATPWGVSMGFRGNVEWFEHVDRDGTVHITRVVWAE